MTKPITTKGQSFDTWRSNTNVVSNNVGEPQSLFTTDGTTASDGTKYQITQDTLTGNKGGVVDPLNVNLVEVLNNINTNKVKRTGDTITGDLRINSDLSVGSRFSHDGQYSDYYGTVLNFDAKTGTTSTLNFFDANVTTVDAWSGGTAITLGATTGTFRIDNANTYTTGDLTVEGADIVLSKTGGSTTQSIQPGIASSTVNLFTTNTTTLSLGSDATTLNFGTATAAQTVNIASGLTTTGSKTISIGNAASTSGSYNTTINLAAASTGDVTLNLASGASTSVTGNAANKSTNIASGALTGVSGATATNDVNIATGAVGVYSTQTISAGTGTVASGSTKTINIGTGQTTASGGATAISIGSSVSAQDVKIADGVNAATFTKNIEIGNNGGGGDTTATFVSSSGIKTVTIAGGTGQNTVNIATAGTGDNDVTIGTSTTGSSFTTNGQTQNLNASVIIGLNSGDVDDNIATVTLLKTPTNITIGNASGVTVGNLFNQSTTGTIQLANAITTGSVSIGNAQTSGSINLANGANTVTGTPTVNIMSGASTAAVAVTRTVNIGVNGGTNVTSDVNIGSTNLGTTTINSPLTKTIGDITIEGAGATATSAYLTIGKTGITSQYFNSGIASSTVYLFSDTSNKNTPTLYVGDYSTTIGIGTQGNGAAQAVTIGSTFAGSTTTIQSPDTTIKGDLQIDGSGVADTGSTNITIKSGTLTNTVDLFKTQTAAINAFNASSSITIGSTTTNQTLNIGTGVLVAANTKTLNIGTGGTSLATSSTTINLGNSTGVITTNINNGGSTTVGTVAAVSATNIASGALTGLVGYVATNTIGIANGVANAYSTQTVNIASGNLAAATASKIVNIGNTASTTTGATSIITIGSGSATTVNVGNGVGTAISNVTIASGSDVNSQATLSLASGSGFNTVTIANGAGDSDVSIGSAVTSTNYSNILIGSVASITGYSVIKGKDHVTLESPNVIYLKTPTVSSDQASLSFLDDTGLNSVTAFTGAETLKLGATTASTTTLNAGTIVGFQSTQDLWNTVATTINFGGAATTMNIGATTGTTTIKSPTVVGSQTSQDLWNTVATTINFGGAATTLNISGAATTFTIGGTPTTGTITADIFQNVTTTGTKTVRIGGANNGGATVVEIAKVTTGDNDVTIGTSTTGSSFTTNGQTQNLNASVIIGLNSGDIDSSNATVTLLKTPTNITIGNASGVTVGNLFNQTTAGAIQLANAITTGSVKIGNTVTTGTIEIGNGTNALTGINASTINILSGASTSGTTATRTANIGVNGSTNVTTNVNIGSTNLGTTTINSPQTTMVGDAQISGGDLVLSTSGGVTSQTITSGVGSSTASVFATTNTTTLNLGSNSSTVNIGDVATNNTVKIGTASTTVSINALTDITSASVSAVTVTTATNIMTFAHATYKVAKLIVVAKQGTEYQATELLVVTDGVDVTMTEYATLETQSNQLASYSVALNGANIEVKTNQATVTSTDYKVSATLIRM